MENLYFIFNIKNNPINEVRCQFCNNFRRHETLSSIFTDLANSEEIKIFNQIKREESKEFQENLKLNNNTNYYAIDLEWFLQWKCYVTNDMTEKQLPNSKKRISSNKSVGVLPPGPIFNTNLFEKNAKEFTDKTFKKGLKKVPFINFRMKIML